MGETYSRDKVRNSTLNDVLGSSLLMLHDVVELSELKRRGLLWAGFQGSLEHRWRLTLGFNNYCVRYIIE